MSNFEKEFPVLNQGIETAITHLPFLEAYQGNITLLTPGIIQILTILACVFIGFKFDSATQKWGKLKHFALLEKVREATPSIYIITFLFIARGIFMYTGFVTTWIDIAIGLTAIKGIPHIFDLTPFKERSKKAFTIISWIILALILTNDVAPVIEILDSVTFTLGSATITPWAVIKAIALFTFLIYGINKTCKLFENKVLKGNRKLSASARTLIVKITNILGLTIAFLITLDIIGIDLAAFAFFGGALGIGIGFGLQKIVGNLISGMILIIDKSIKPGDVISLGESYGVITAMHARYCVMRRRDGMEILIPNELLMTNEVINWSYNNKNVRTIISVGVSYDSDIERVQEILIELTTNHPRILTDPAPRALITAFADSSINFEVRFWISDPEEGLGAIRSEIYMKIWKRFKEEGIEIPFPQRVIHHVDGSAIKKS